MSDISVNADWAQEVLDFWLHHIGPEQWWARSDATDALIVHRFRETWEDLRHRPADTFLTRAEEALAAILLFDQLPRNMVRGEAKAFATDPLARDIAHGAVARSYDTVIGGPQKIFFYMPFQHSEALEDQRLSIRLFTALNDPDVMPFARAHHDIIARFGRFPHRNAALGRTTLPQEKDAAAQGHDW